jgi:hypothetical protein
MLTAMLLLAATCQPVAGAPFPRSADAVFIEADTPRDWAEFLGRVGKRDIVIANIRGFDKEVDACKAGCNKPEAVKLIKAAPDTANIYVGLVYDKQFHGPAATDASLKLAADRDIKAARWLLKQLTASDAAKIKGWYLAREIYNFAEEAPERAFRKYYARLSRDLPPGELLIAPFFLPATDQCGARNAIATAAMFRCLTKDTRISRVMLQDGFAERNKHDVCKTDISFPKYEPHARAYEEAMAAIGQPWVIVEAFELESGRLERQLAILPKGAKVAVYESCDCIETRLCQ